ncbi:MAG: hypothetical protein ACJAQ6_000801 [Arenicella sp.]|jgi:hypothetical protein
MKKLDLGEIGEPPNNFKDEEKYAWYELVESLAPENRLGMYRASIFIMATNLPKFKRGELESEMVKVLFDYFRDFEMTPMRQQP